MTRHRLDVFSFLAGLVCVGASALAFADPSGLTIEDLRIAGPATVLLLGLALLIGGGGRDRVPADGDRTIDGDAPDADRPATSNAPDGVPPATDVVPGAGLPAEGDEPGADSYPRDRGDDAGGHR